ncbi:YcaO-like family protein, partial [Staphylococcus lutrae]
MNCNKVDSSLFIDEKYGLIKNIYSFPTYYGLPKVYVKMAFGGNYSTAGFNASGAGITPENAENSAVGEYIERYSCLHPNNLEVIKEGIKKIDPSYLNSEASNNYDDYKWKECLDCVNNKIVALPVDAIYLTYRSNKTNRWITTATGAACGENQYQCMWKGISEVLERDAFQYIWRRQLPCKRISIEANTILKKYFDNYIKCSNIKFRLYKMELDWNVPAVFGVAEFQNGGCVVAACVRHTWIEACKKTLLELTQSIIGYAAVVFNKERIRIDNFDNINDYQDHSILYFNDNMCKHLYFLDKENKEFN